MRHPQSKCWRVIIMIKIKLGLRVCWGVVSWVLFECVNIPLMLLGWVLVPIMAALKQYGNYNSYVLPSKDVIRHPSPLVHWKSRWMFIWDNYEDGIANNSYSHYKSMFKRIVSWYNRNPTNNLRVVPILSCKVQPMKIRYVGTFGSNLLPYYGMEQQVRKYDTKVPHWFFCWQGLYSCFYWNFMFRGKLISAFIGWKLYPTDILGVTPYRKYGAGFGSRFRRIL